MHLSAELSAQLTEAGLEWKPTLHDFFMLPDTGLDDRVFVLVDMMANLEVLKGWPAITFNGTAEWALDYVFIRDALWMPTEAQLRTRLQEAIGPDSAIHLRIENGVYECEVTIGEAPLYFRADNASDAYGQALLAQLKFSNKQSSD